MTSYWLPSPRAHERPAAAVQRQLVAAASPPSATMPSMNPVGKLASRTSVISLAHRAAKLNAGMLVLLCCTSFITWWLLSLWINVRVVHHSGLVGAGLQRKYFLCCLCEDGDGHSDTTAAVAWRSIADVVYIWASFSVTLALLPLSAVQQ